MFEGFLEGFGDSDLKAEVGETVRLQAPGGLRELEIIDVAYVALD